MLLRFIRLVAVSTDAVVSTVEGMAGILKLLCVEGTG